MHTFFLLFIIVTETKHKIRVEKKEVDWNWNETLYCDNIIDL